jgi:MoxR-like ATPase
MEEHQVTVDGVTYPTPQPFMVMATQNPIEYEGTFPLPEAQLDRFMLRVRLGYPGTTDEMAILDAQQFTHPIEQIAQIASAEELLDAQRGVKEVYVDTLIKEYILALIEATRKHPDVYLGASPRGSLALYKTAQVRAAIHARDYVIPDDIKALAEPALAHRLIISPAARLKNVDARAVVDELIHSVAVPGSRAG